MKLRWGTTLFGLLAVAGCDVSVCTDRDALGNCVDIHFPDFDATVRVDGGGTSDGAVSDAGAVVVAPDGGLAMSDGGMDGGAVVDAGPVAPTSLTLQQFCELRYAVAMQWRDAYFAKCCLSNQDLATSNDILGKSFSFPVDMDPVGICVSSIQGLPPANLTFVGTAAAACAARISSQFAAPPAVCPAAGIDVNMLEATIGHQVASPVQLSECRAAFVGQVALGGACTNSLECKAGARCLGDSGAKTCRAPTDASGSCAFTSECADGLVCVRAAGSTNGQVCRPASEPLDVTVSCTQSTECRSGLICTAEKCANPTPSLICKQ